MGRRSPGPCSICGAAHTTCTADSGPIVIPQLAARDARQAGAQFDEPPVELVLPVADADPPSTADRAALGDGTDDRPFSTATYRGKKKRGLSSRA